MQKKLKCLACKNKGSGTKWTTNKVHPINIFRYIQFLYIYIFIFTFTNTLLGRTKIFKNWDAWGKIVSDALKKLTIKIKQNKIK